MIDDLTKDDFDKYVTPAAKPARKQREFRTDRNNNPIAAAVTTGGRNQFTDALDQAEIPWEHGDPFPGNPKLSTIRIKGDPYEGARAILSNSNALKWYRGTTGKQILPKYGIRSNTDFAKLPIDHQNDIINGIYQSEGGRGLLKPSDDDFDKYVSRGTSQPDAQSNDDDFDKYVTPFAQVDSGVVGEQPKLKTPKVTSTVTDYEPEKLEPIKFQPADLSNETNLTTRAAQGVAENVRMQGTELPKTHPNLLGQRVTAKFDHQPTAEEVDDALMENLGKGYGTVARKFREEMGVPLSRDAAVTKQPDGSYVAHARATQGLVDAVNAYALGGKSAYANTLTSQQMGKAAVARDVNAELKRGEGVAQDLGQAGAREVVRSAQFLQNAADLANLQAPEDDPKARAIAAAGQSIPAQTTSIGSAAEIPLSAAGAITRAEALGGAPGFPASAAIENAQAGPEAAYRAGIMTAPILAAGPIAESVGANEMSPLARQATVRSLAGAGMATPAVASGASPLEVAKEAAVGALFPTGERGQVERPTELGIDRAPVVGVPGRGALDADRIIAEREAAVKPVTDAQGNVLLNADEIARDPSVKPKIQLANSPTPEPAHLANFRERAPDGTFVEGAARIPDEFKPENVAPKEGELPAEVPAVAESVPQVIPETTPKVGAIEPAQADLQPLETATPEPQKPAVEPSVEAAQSPAAIRPESTTSAKKAQLANDRAELDLPELSQAERKSWRTSLINAKEKGLDQRAERLADQILKNPRALDDEQTAGMTLRLQQLKNEHADLLKSIDTETDATKLAEQRADLESVEESFDKITEAVKKSGTEKGRTLAAQKLTINQDFDLVSMLNRYKAKTGKEPTPEIRAQIETQQKRIAELEKQLTEKSTKGAVSRIEREVRRENRQRTRKVLDEEAATIKTNLAAEFARIKTQNIAPSGLAGIDPEGAITKLALKYAKNRFEAGLTDAAQLVDDVHSVLSEFMDVSKRQVAEMISGYQLPQKPETKESLEKSLADVRREMRTTLRQADVESGAIQPKSGPRETKGQIQRRYQKQINEIERRIREKDFGPKPKRGPTVLDAETERIHVNLERAKQDFQRKLREWQASQRSRPEKMADLAVQWGRAAKLMYVSTLGKLGSAATGRMVMSPLENLIGEIPHRAFPELSKKATTEGGGFDRAAEVAALWKSGRFRAMLEQVTKGGSDLDVLFGGQKSIDKEMSSGGVLGLPGRIHGAMKEYPRQAEFDRAFVKVLKNYDQQGRDISRPDVQLAARMEAYNAAERARFQQKNIISDLFNSTMNAAEHKGGVGKVISKLGRFTFPITRVPVNVVNETLNYTLGLPRGAAEHIVRNIRGTMTPEKADNIMRAYKKGGVGLAVMTYAFLNPKQFGGYYQKGDKRDPNEPKPGEVMFFGKRIPKVFTHVPILEAAQLAATARRVMDRMAEQGKADSTLEGGLAAGKGLASEVPFYETPARFFTGQEGARGSAEIASEQVRGLIPGFIQEAAKITDKDKEGNPIPRSPQGSFAQRFAQGVKMGVPGLRQQVPKNESVLSKQRVQSFSDRLFRKEIDEKGIDRAVQNSELTPGEVDSILKEKEIRSEYTPFQASFYRAPTLTADKDSTALNRYKRLVDYNDPKQYEVREIMQEKADAILDSDQLTLEQKKAFADRIKKVGLLVRGFKEEQ